MATQTLGSRAGGGAGGTLEPKSNALAGQGSLYSLTLDEFQHQLGDLGKPLSSMNLDELLRTVWSAEASQGQDSIDYSAPQPGQLPSVSSLNRESSLTLTRDLSKKTVDEVWQGIQRGQKRSIDRKAHNRQPTLGEMTLEDFLVKAGVVAESAPGNKSSGPMLGVEPMAMPHQNVPQPVPWMHYQIPSIHQTPQQQQLQQQNLVAVYLPGHPVQQPLPIVSNQMMDVAYPESQMEMSPSALIGTLSDTQTPGRKRAAPGVVVEKTVERRQKRMIKNRESAARSRARKQAYTHELENKVSRLEEENERLKRLREVEKVLPAAPTSEPRYQLRRTSSALF